MGKPLLPKIVLSHEPFDLTAVWLAFAAEFVLPLGDVCAVVVNASAKATTAGVA